MGKVLRRQTQNRPFYGQTPELRTYVCRSQAKQGTTRFFRIATAYLMWRDVRLTLAMTYVLPEHSTLEVVQRLLQRLTLLGFSQMTLFLDKGFCCGDVLQYLQAHHQPAILACAIRGTTGGTRALCTGRHSYRTTYTFTDGTVVEVAMVAKLPRGRDGRRRRKWLMFVLVELDWSPHSCKTRYRRRFGIECSYRQGRQVRIRTNAMNPALRFFCLGLSPLLVNVWIALRWTFARHLGRGPRRVDPDRFRLHRFVHFLMRAIERAFGVIMSIPTHRSPQFVIYWIWHKVKSHTGVHWNELVDELAKQGALSKGKFDDGDPQDPLEVLEAKAIGFLKFLSNHGIVAEFKQIYNDQYARIMIEGGLFDLYNTPKRPLSPYLHAFKDRDLQARVQELWDAYVTGSTQHDNSHPASRLEEVEHYLRIFEPYRHLPFDFTDLALALKKLVGDDIDVLAFCDDFDELEHIYNRIKAEQ